MTDEKPESTRGAKIAAAIIIAIVLLLIFSALSGGESPTEDNKQEATSITQSEAEQFCQDAALLGKHVNLDKVSIVNATNYNPVLTETGDNTASFQWSGKNKDTGNSVLFVCDVSGDKELKLESLAIDGEQVL